MVKSIFCQYIYLISCATGAQNFPKWFDICYNEADGWNNFVINSQDCIRKDPFFYRIVDGSIDYDYLKSIVE